MDDGGVGLDIDCFYGEGRDFCEEDAAEGVGDGGIDVDEVELGEERGIAVEFDAEGLLWWVLVGEWRGKMVGEVRQAKRTSLNLLISHAWSSFGQCPGKSVEVTFVTISA